MRPAKPKTLTIKDVAREAGVSVASVSRVVNGQENVSEETRTKVLATVERLRYAPHLGARSLITRRTHVIGVVLPDLWGEFFSELIRGIDAAAREAGLHLLLSGSHGDAREMAAAIRAMRGRVEGLLIMAPGVGDGPLDEAGVSSVPTVLMNSPPEARAGRSSVTIDNYGGARAMVRHLVARGHRSIAHIAGPADNFDAMERLRGYRDELAASLPDTAAQVIAGDFSEASGHAAGRVLAAAPDRPDAVFAANDATALGCLAAFAAAGVRVPGDVGVAGFDDIPMAAFAHPSLTTVRVRIDELGKSALRRLAADLDNPQDAGRQNQTFEPETIVRDSCGPRPGGR